MNARGTWRRARSTGAAGLIVASLFPHSVVMLVVGFTLSQVGQRSVMSVFWAIPPMLLAGIAAAAGIALINAVGNLGGFVGPSVMGALRQWTGAAMPAACSCSRAR